MKNHQEKNSSKHRDTMFQGAGEVQPAQGNAQSGSATSSLDKCTPFSPVRICSCCHLSYPLTDFYRTKNGYDCYCKSCRRMRNRFQAVKKSGRNYLVITEMEDAAFRLELVRELHRKIGEMVMRNVHKRIEEEAERELRYWKGGMDGTR